MEPKPMEGRMPETADEIALSTSFFDGKELDEKSYFYDKDDEWNRCQVGWQIGATLDINQFNVGIGYALDFNEICEKTKTSKFAVTVGYNF